MLGNFSSTCCYLLTFFKINFFSKKYFRNTIRVSNRLGLDQMFCLSWSGSKLFAKVISIWQKALLARKEVTIRQPTTYASVQSVGKELYDDKGPVARKPVLGIRLNQSAQLQRLASKMEFCVQQVCNYSIQKAKNQLQRLASIMKFWLQQVCDYSIQEAKNKSADQTALAELYLLRLFLFIWNCLKIRFYPHKVHLSLDMRFPTMWYVRLANSQIRLHIRAVWSEPLLVAWIFYDCYATDWT